MRWPLALALCAACTSPLAVRETLERTEQTLELAHRVYGPLCAPVEMAYAETAADFTRIELHQGSAHRADRHVREAYDYAITALEKATPCGGADRDRDTIPDIVDRCADEPEDFDGDKDDDGCKDIDPHGDDDGDGIANVDDGCPEVPEDFDGHNDDDGCPETSEDSDGDGIVDVVDQCRMAAEDIDNFQDSDGCPDPDNDNDNIPDFRDACAMSPEDIDGWMDDDGCPDADNDLDGIADVIDKCPNEPGDRQREGCPLQDGDGDGIADINDRCLDQPETKNGYLDEDGCPDTPPSRVRVTRQRVLPDDTVKFTSGSAYLAQESYALLDSIVQVLNDAPTMRLRIEGHTDAQGGDDANLRLSRDRADSVRTYLMSKGISESRLTATGFGETKPVDTNRTERGRALNRRVEFHILE